MEVIQCHQPEGQNQKTLNTPALALDLMLKPKSGLRSIANSIKLLRERQYAGEYICFWRKKNRNSPPP